VELPCVYFGGREQRLQNRRSRRLVRDDTSPVICLRSACSDLSKNARPQNRTGRCPLIHSRAAPTPPTVPWPGPTVWPIPAG
jgi:hypothetical protein